MEKLELTDVDYGNLAKALRKVDFFAPMTIGQLEMILPYILLVRYAPGETIFSQGDIGDAFYIVYDGKVNVRVKKFLVFSKAVAELGEGAFFGEMALLSSEPRNATLVAQESTRLFVLLSRDFQFVLKKNPEFAEEMRKIAEQRKFMSRNQ
jgi:CRP-like cAMP-binding protein